MIKTQEERVLSYKLYVTFYILWFRKHVLNIHINVHNLLLDYFNLNERKSEQGHIPHAPTLLENAVYNEWQFQALGTGNRTKKGI